MYANASNLAAMGRYAYRRRGRRVRLGAAASLVALTVAVCLAVLSGSGGEAARAASLPRRSTADGGSGESYPPVIVAGTAAPATPSGVSGGALFGGNNALIPLEPQLGRSLAVVRLYFFIGDAFPGRYGQALAGGRTVIASFDSNGPSYASIAAGNEDANIITFLRSVDQAAINHYLGAIYVSFEHEPDAHSSRTLGTPAQFIQAWDHVHQLAESAHLDWNDGGRLHWVFILIHNSYASWRASAFWPGPGEADIVAADGYNSSGCKAAGGITQATPASLFDPLLSFAAAHGMPAFITEWGSDTIPSGVQPQFIQEMQAYVAAHGRIAAALYWNSGHATCNYQVNNQPASIAALTAMGQSPALQGHISHG